MLVHHDEAAFEKIAKENQQQMIVELVRLTHDLHANKQYLRASPPLATATAAIVRDREGKPFVTDGPFIETRDRIAGYFLIHARDRDVAISIAARVPGARIGSVEVRPLIDIPGLPSPRDVCRDFWA